MNLSKLPSASFIPGERPGEQGGQKRGLGIAYMVGGVTSTCCGWGWCTEFCMKGK